MKFGLIYELQNPKPWTDRSEFDTYHNALYQIEVAEQAGFDMVWEVEHHFLSEYSHSSSPECFLAAASQRTSVMRLGQGVALLPYNFNHPVRVAERAAALDILSNGRFDLGTGRSITEAELGGFRIDPKDSKPMWKEAVEMIPKMWMQETYSHEGTYFNVPERPILPKPIQTPHPPMWVAATQPNTFVEAGERGLGALCFGFGAASALGSSVTLYRDAINTCQQPVGAFINNQIGASTVMFCADNEKDVKQYGYPASFYFLGLALKLFAPWYGKEVEGYEYYTQMTREAMKNYGKGAAEQGINLPGFNVPRAGGNLPSGFTGEEMTNTGASCVGKPDALYRAVELYEQEDIDQMVFLVQCGKIPHEKIVESLKLFGKEVIPHFKAREAEREKKRRAEEPNFAVTPDWAKSGAGKAAA